jgi:hypothetical protein
LTVPSRGVERTGVGAGIRPGRNPGVILGVQGKEEPVKTVPAAAAAELSRVAKIADQRLIAQELADRLASSLLPLSAK